MVRVPATNRSLIQCRSSTPSSTPSALLDAHLNQARCAPGLAPEDIGQVDPRPERALYRERKPCAQRAEVGAVLSGSDGLPIKPSSGLTHEQIRSRSS